MPFAWAAADDSNHHSFQNRSRRAFASASAASQTISAKTLGSSPGRCAEFRYFLFKSCLRRLTISLAVRSIWRELASFGGLYVDHTTSFVFASTRNNVPLARLNDEFTVIGGSLPAVSLNMDIVLGGSSPFAFLAGFSGCSASSFSSASGEGGGGYRSRSFASKPSPIWSVRMASAIFGSVTIWKRRWFVSRLARYWSIPFDILSTYTFFTLARSAPNARTAGKHNTSTSRFIHFMITRRTADEKRRRHV